MDTMVLVLFAGVIVVGLLLMVIMGMSRRSTKRVLDKEAYQKDWLAIEMTIGRDASSQQFAILQADKLLDRALRERGFRGETMGERMTAASRVFTRRDAVWAAHKLRNRIAHEDSIKVNSSLTAKAMGSFKRGLKDLGAL